MNIFLQVQRIFGDTIRGQITVYPDMPVRPGLAPPKLMLMPGDQVRVLVNGQVFQGDPKTLTPPQSIQIKKKGPHLQLALEERVLAEVEDFYLQPDVSLLGNDWTYTLDSELVVQPMPAPAPVESSAQALTEISSTGSSAWSWASLSTITKIGGGILGVLAIVGGCGGSSSSPAATPTPQLATVEGALVAGPVTNAAELSVQIFDQNGQLIGESPLNADGTFRITLSREYSGNVLVKLIDQGTGEDYIDEATAAPKDLSLNILRAVGQVTAGEVVQIYITPLSELAVRKLLDNDDGTTTATAGKTAAEFLAASQAALSALGFGGASFNVFSDQPIPKITTKGQLQSGNEYGAALAALSAYEAGDGVTKKNTAEVLREVRGESAPNSAAMALNMVQAVLKKWDAASSTGDEKNLVRQVLGITSPVKFELPETEITALDVDGQIVVSADSLAGTPSDLVAVSGGKIRLVHTTDATRAQEIDVTDTRFVTISGNKVIIKPPFDFDFGGAYRVEVDAKAFTATVAGVTGTQSRAMVAADDLSFGTVDIAGANSVSNAKQGQVVNNDGTVANGKKWIDGSGQGDWDAGTTVDFDLAGGDYAVVVKDGGTSAGRIDTGDGVEIKAGFNLGLSNVGSSDRIYVDDTANNKAALNNRQFSQITSNPDGGLNVAFNPSDDADGKGSNIHIKSVEAGSGLSLTDAETVRGVLNVSNTRLGSTITAIERVGTDASQDFGGDLAADTTFDVKVSANLRTGDKVQLVRLDTDGHEFNWGSEVQASADDIAAGHITLKQSSLTDFNQGRNTIYAKITGTDGAVTKSAMLFGEQGGFDYDTTPPKPVLSLASAEDALTPEVSEDATLTDTENSVHVEITDGWAVGDKYQLKLGSSNLGSEVTITRDMLDTNGKLFVTINKADLGAAGTKSISVSITDRAGNTGTAAAALELEVLDYVTVSGAIVAGPVMADNDLVVTAYDVAGNVIGQDDTVQAGAGSYSLNILKTHTGPVLIKVSSKGAKPDYMDEGTGAGMDLTSNTFFAVTTASGSNVSAHVTPLTDVAAKKLMTGQQLSSGVGASDVQTANQVVAQLFLGQASTDITSLQPTATINTDGTANTGSANLYGQVLEQISKQASSGKTFADVQAELVTGLDWAKGQASADAAITASSAAGKAQVLAKLQFNVQNTAGIKLDITLTDLTNLGITGVSGLSAERQTALLDTLKNATSLDVVGSTDRLQTQANKAVATAKIQDYAAGVEGVTAPTLNDYNQAGVTGVSAANLQAVNVAVKDAGEDGVGDLSAIQTAASTGATNQTTKLDLLTAYADTGTTAPTVDDYHLAGVTGVNASNLLAVNAVLLAKTADEANELSELQAIVITGQSHHEAALQVLRNYIRDDAANSAPNADHYRDAGVVTNGTPTQVSNFNTFMRQADNSTADSSASDLALPIGKFDRALTKIERYGESGHTQSADTPSVEDYQDALVQHVTSDNLAAINTAVSALSSAVTNTPALVQSVVDAYRAVFAAADGTAAEASVANDAVSLAQFTALGLSGVSSADHARVLSAVVDGKAAADVNTLSKLQALADAVAAVFTGAAGGTAPTLDQWRALGFTVTDSTLAGIAAALAATADNGSGVDTLAKLKAVVANDAPTTTDATITATENTDRVFTLDDFAFADAADTPANSLSKVLITALPIHGTLTLDGEAVTLNQAIDKADIEVGKLVYRAADNAFGTSYSTIKFKVQDDGGTDNGGVDTSAEQTLSVDVQAIIPTVSSVAITSATGIENKTLNADDVVTVTVTFNEAVTVTGTPQLALLVGTSTKQAQYAGGSGTNTLTFTYTIASGDNDSNGISIASNALQLNGGSIRDSDGHNAILSHTAVNDNTNYLVDTVSPTAAPSYLALVDNIQPASVGGSLTLGDSTLFQISTVHVNFDRDVNNFIEISYRQADGTVLSFTFNDVRTNSVLTLSSAFNTAFSASPLASLFDSGAAGASGARTVKFYLQAKDGVQLDESALTIKGTMPVNGTSVTLTDALANGSAPLVKLYQGMGLTSDLKPDGTQDNRLTFEFDGGIAKSAVDTFAKWTAAFRDSVGSTQSETNLFGAAPTYLPSPANKITANGGVGRFLHLTLDPSDSNRVLKAEILLGSASNKDLLLGGKFTFGTGDSAVVFNAPTKFINPTEGLENNTPELLFSLSGTGAQEGGALVLYKRVDGVNTEVGRHVLTAEDIQKQQAKVTVTEALEAGSNTLSVALADPAGNLATRNEFVTLKVQDNASPTGNITPEVTSVTIGGLTKVDGSSSLANGTYRRVAEADLDALDFGTGFSPEGGPSLLDRSKPVYRYTDSDGAVWYAWARMGSGYHISKLANTSEWYWEGSAGNTFADSLLGVETAGNSWVLSDAPASVVVSDQASHTWAQGSATVADWAAGALVSINTSSLADPDGLGTLSYQWQQSVDGSTNWTAISDATSASLTLPDGLTGRYLRVQIRYTDLKGRNETFLTQATQVTDNRPPRLDLNSESSGNHHQVNISTNGEAVAVSSKPSVAESATINKVVIGINSNDVALTAGEQLSLIGLSFNLDGTNLPASFDVGSVTWTPTYDTATSSLIFTASGAGATASSIQAMGSNMQYVNTNAPSGNRVLSFSVFDASGNQSNTANTTITFDQAGPEIDLNAVTAGSGHAQTLTDAAIARGGVLLGATTTVQDNSALASLRVSVSGLVDGDSELITLGSTEFKANGTGLPSTVSDGTHTWALAYSNGVFSFTQAAGHFAALDAQALLQALGFKNTATTPGDGVRVFDISATDQHGLVAEAARSRVAINLALPTVAASNAMVTIDADGDGIKGDVFTIRFSEPIEASRVSNTANWTLSGGATLGTGATIEALNPITIEGVAYAAQFRITGGTGRSYTTGTTFTLASSNVVDSTGGLATSSAVFTISDIVAPTSRPVPPLNINQDSSTSNNEINATERAASTSIAFSFTASADNARIRYYLNGIELASKSTTLNSTSNASTLTLTGDDWGADGTHTLTARIEDAAGNLGTASTAKTIKVDTGISASMTLLMNDADGSGTATAGDVVTLVFGEAVTLSNSGLPTGVFGTSAPTPVAVAAIDGKSQTWTVTLNAGSTLSPSSTFSLTGITDQAGNTGTVTVTAPDDLFNLPGAPRIATVTSDNVINTAEAGVDQSITINLSRAKVGDVVTLYMDGVSVGTATVASNGQASIAISVGSHKWGGDGERVLSAEVKRGDGTAVSSTENRHVYINGDAVHWSANKSNVLWYDPETLTAGASVTSAWGPSVGVGTTTVQGAAPTVIRTAEGRLMLHFSTAANNTNYLSIASSTIGGSRPANTASFTAFKLDATASGFLYPVAYGNFGDSSGYLYAYQYTDASKSMGGVNWALNTNQSGGSNSAILGAPTVYSYQVTTQGSTRTAELAVNGTSNLTSGITGGSGGSAIIPTSGQNLTIGWGKPQWEGTRSSMKGQVGDVIVSHSVFTNAEQQEIETYLAVKYRTQGNVVTSAKDGVFDLSSKLDAVLVDHILDRRTHGSRNDTIHTAGADYVNAGAGDDQVHVKDLAFRHLDGGTGADTLLLHTDFVGTSSIVLADMVSNARGNSGDSVADARVNAAGWHKLYGFEKLDLSTSAAKQTLTVAAADVNQLSETNTLGVVLGDNDVLNVSGFTAVNPEWGYYSVGSQTYTQKYVDSTGAITLYAIGGNSQPQVSGASYSGNVLTLNFNEALTSSAALVDWSVSGGASTINSLAQSGTGNNTLSFTMASLTANSVVRLTYNGTALTDTDGKALRFKEVWVANGANDTLDASAGSTGVALFGNGGADVLSGGAGSDKLVGGQGNDTLTGGAGADIFAFIKGELSQDTVTDFGKTQGDKLDLSLLLDGAGMDKSSQESINKFLQLTQSGNDAVLKISVTGSGDFTFADQSITMTNAWASGGMNEDIMTLMSNRVILA